VLEIEHKRRAKKARETKLTSPERNESYLASPERQATLEAMGRGNDRGDALGPNTLGR